MRENRFGLRDWAAYSCLAWLLVIGTLDRAAAQSVGPAPILLWPQGAPGAVGEAEHDRPSIRLYQPPAAERTGAAIVVCPGGGYGILATDHEGHQVARWLNTIGVTAAVLRYRHAPHYRHPAPLTDAQRAIRYLRHHHQKLGIDADRVGIMGFSAGGHLASTAATHFDSGLKSAADPLDRHSSRPDFAVLAYPVISLTADFAHRGSARNLLGDDPQPELLKSLSNETQVTADTPPTFLFHTAADRAVPVENSIAFFRALTAHGVKAELHVFQDGPHGVGLAPGDPVAGKWTSHLQDWLRANGLLHAAVRAAVQGQVSLDGQPLRWGTITLVPQRKTMPVIAAMINRGKFRIPADSGPQVGQYSIEVRSLGDVRPEPTIDDVQTLTHSTIQYQVSADGPNQIQLELTSQ